MVSTPLPLNLEGGRGWVILENYQTGGGVGKIKILGGVTGSRGGGDIFRVGCSFSLITFFNNVRNESVNFWLCSVQIFIHYHNNIALKEQPLEVFLENRCSEKYVFWKVAR